MKIATWNLERLIKNKNEAVLAKIKEIDADIFVLTETNSTISLEDYNSVCTETLSKGQDGIAYKERENRESIWTKYPILKSYETYDRFTSVCADIETPLGVLTVYGTIIGVFANKQPRFDEDLFGQIEDFNRIFPGKQVCIIGDLNIMFSGFAYLVIRHVSQSMKCVARLKTTNIICKSGPHYFIFFFFTG
ncbi:MAG: hypothetical protein R2799_00060 [Crocinitomicaceae bacterium]